MASDWPDELYEYPDDHIGRRRYVSVRGHAKSVPAFKTYRGSDSRNHILPEYGGDGSGFGNGSAYIMPDKAAYVSPMDGALITSRSTHREHMIRHGVIEAGDMPLPTRQRDRDAHRPVTGREIAESIRQLGGH